MSHLIVKGFDVVYVPDVDKYRETWHGLQTIAGPVINLDGSNISKLFCPLYECGVKPDFQAEVSIDLPEDLRDEKGEMASAMANWKLIVADCRNGEAKRVIPVHIPKNRYQIHQNELLFNCMVKSAEKVLGSSGFEIVTVGTLGGFTQFFISLVIKGQEKFTVGKLANGLDDNWNQFFNLNSSHNGLIASNRMISTVRIVCMNTVQMSIANAEAQDTITEIKHTSNSLELLTPEIFAQDLQAWITRSENFRKTLGDLKAMPMSLDQFRFFACGVFTNPESDQLSVNSFNRIADMESLFAKGDGNEGKSAYDAINAFTQFFTSGAGVGNKKTVALNKRIASANFGRGNDWKVKAILTASDVDTYADALKRGEVLFNDYHIAQAKKAADKAAKAK